LEVIWLDIVVAIQSAVPAYEQIKEQIKAEIMSGNIKAGEMLPSVRALARDLKVSNITTIRAYNDLENEGLVNTVQGRGCYVNNLPHDIIRKQYMSEVNMSLAIVVQKGVAAGLTLNELKRKLEEKYNECN
jgi:GntR family transcriptional regulator